MTPEARKLAQARSEREAADLRTVMDSPEGRRHIWRTLSKCGIHRQSYIPDSDSTAFNEGQRSIGLWQYAELQSNCADLYALMVSEAVNEALEQRRADEHERSTRNDDA